MVRTPASSKRANEARFAVVAAAAAHAGALGALGAPLLARLRAHLARGPYALDMEEAGVLTASRA
jgi:hypothetical protein